MKAMLEPGKYVVAVSGGVDSIALLNMLSKQNDIDLIVAHFDHGIRKDSTKDRVFVQALAKKYGLPFEFAEGNLGSTTSEAVARQVRYAFLHSVKDKFGAQAIVTAHHQDDLIETAIINLLRGTGRKGLTALSSRDDVVRPLLHVPKVEILEYAKEHGLKWHEDITNQETKYLRNYVRHEILPKFSDKQKQHLMDIVEKQKTLNTNLDELLQLKDKELDRKWFVGLPHGVAKEVMAAWLRGQGLREFDRAAIERAVVGAKTAGLGKKVEVKKGVLLEVGREKLALVHPER